VAAAGASVGGAGLSAGAGGALTGVTGVITGGLSAALAVAAAAVAVVAVAFECGGSPDVPMMTSAAVPTTTQTPVSTKHTRSAMLGFGASVGNEACDTCERGPGTASGA
jgi:hypothetical protein